MKHILNDKIFTDNKNSVNLLLIFLFSAVILFAGCGGGGQTSSGDLLTSPGAEYLPLGDGTDDLAVTKEIHVAPGKIYAYRNVNIYGGGRLVFDDVTSSAGAGSLLMSVVNSIRRFLSGASTKTETHFWAKSLLVENEGALIAGSEDAPYQSVLVFHLYGSNTDTQGITCQTTDAPKRYCGVDADTWSGHNSFYHYESLPDETLTNSSAAFFGRKVFAVSYGGALQLFGAKGMTKGAITDAGAASGKSWARLNQTASMGATSITLDRVVDWEAGDQIVITTTDFLPGHSEQREIADISNLTGKSVITLTGGLTYRHNGEAYSLAGFDLSAQGITKSAVETRAAVALLTRNIRIVSAGNSISDSLPAAESTDTNRYFGAHAVIRQGFAALQIQGVEFYQMGQGGMLARSPLQFLGVYDPPDGTFVRDCSIHDSMTRWIELRGAQNLLLERNVGYKSIGHGYMSAGHEANNTYRANIGIYARPALKYRDNPRSVPGVYANTPANAGWDYGVDSKDMSTQSDYITPAVFLIANPFNTYEFNMAAGAGACGSCYWIVPGPAAGPPEEAPAGYISAMQKDYQAPLKSFKGNFCSTAQYSLLTIAGITTCNGVTTCDSYEGKDRMGNVLPLPLLVPVKNEIQHALNVNSASNYQPKLSTGNCIKGDTSGCTVTVIDSYTSSFHWGQQNWSAIWLRNNWFLFTDSALTDIMGPGLTMVSGGSYDQVINGYWALTRRSVFVGQTQSGNDFATSAGPKLNTATGLKCEGNQGAYCLFSSEGISIPTDNFLNYQRFYNIYDGPVYQEANAYLDIRAQKVGKNNSEYIYGEKSGDSHGYDANRGLGIPKAKEAAKDGSYIVGDCILTNAAIGWKQPNGFYYPPAFHSNILKFSNVDLRHFVLIPLFKEGETSTDNDQVKAKYCTYAADNFFNDFTDVDRQTELNDDDGSLSGIKGAGTNGSISLNNDTYFQLPKITYQCASEQSCFQAPYDHVTANIFPKCLAKGGETSGVSGCAWQTSCGDAGCKTGIALYRQYLNTHEPTPGKKQMIRMLGKGLGQRVNLIADRGKYYLDTANNNAQNNFQAGHTYYVYLLYAKADTKVTFQIYLGTGADASTVLNAVKAVRVGTSRPDGVVITAPFEFNAQSGWLWDAAGYNAASGILTVTIDMSKYAQDFADGAREACKPSSVCEWKGTYCGCAATVRDIGYSCEDAVCRWSSKAMECPAGGCIGFQFTMPSTFTADGGDHRPAAEVFPAEWNIDWASYLVDPATAGSCYYGTTPPLPW